MCAHLPSTTCWFEHPFVLQFTYTTISLFCSLFVVELHILYFTCLSVVLWIPSSVFLPAMTDIFFVWNILRRFVPLLYGFETFMPPFLTFAYVCLVLTYSFCSLPTLLFTRTYTVTPFAHCIFIFIFTFNFSVDFCTTVLSECWLLPEFILYAYYIYVCWAFRT